MSNRKFRLALLCGGPSRERGISLNSARSICDHLASAGLEVLPVYFDYQKRAYAISRAQLYSNTPSDFDFKLKSTATTLSQSALVRHLRSADLIFPAIHGPFGEDGKIQEFLEHHKLPFVGSPAAACKQAFDKYRASEFLEQQGYFSFPCALIRKRDRNFEPMLRKFFETHRIKRAIVKPATGGSSIAVFSVSTVKEAAEKARHIFDDEIDERVVVEPFCTGTEFTVIILQNRDGVPVAILPTEIEIDYRDHQIFDYRKKYLATRQVTYHCPPRFKRAIVDKIRSQAEELFQLIGMRDFARFDGWVLPNGKLWFSDFNPISGMEQNSFLFIQSSRIGMSHQDLLRYVVESAARRCGISIPKAAFGEKTKRKKQEVAVLFGGETAERQVSLMSGTNVWLKLRRSTKFAPKPFLLDRHHRVWSLPYAFALNHTVEEIEEMCRHARRDESLIRRYKQQILSGLKTKPGECSEPWFLPERQTLAQFIRRHRYIFIGLHGGIGENGVLQQHLERSGVKFNGPGSRASKLCMDKYATGKVIEKLAKHGIFTAKRKRIASHQFKNYSTVQYRSYWNSLVEELGSSTLIVKPIGDGCSAGVARLYDARDLETYITFTKQGIPMIPSATLTRQHGIIDMPTRKPSALIFEQFIATDHIVAKGNRLEWTTETGWIEVTVGLLEDRRGLRALSPSLTVAVGSVLSLEEKFQGGTGINITPPPAPYVKPAVVKLVRKRIEIVGRALGIRGYSRIDAFMHVKTGELIIIEANTLPGLTPATVIFHQALAESPPLYPVEFLEKVIEASSLRNRSRSRGQGRSHRR